MKRNTTTNQVNRPGSRHGLAILVSGVCLGSVLVPSAGAAPATRADLVVKAVTTPTTAKPGESVNFTVSVKNAGRDTAPATKTTVWLSTDKSVGGDTKIVGGAKTSSVRPGKSKSLKLTALVPTATADGDYYLIACADASTKVRESKEKNNCRTSASTLKVSNEFEGTLSGTLSFVDAGESSTGLWDKWNRSAKVTISMSVSGPHMEEIFASTGSSYSIAGTLDNVDATPSCTYERHRTESGAGTLLYTGNAVNDDVYGKFTKTDLSGVSLGIAMPFAAEVKDSSCETTKTTTAPSRDTNSIKFSEVSRTATTITYRPVEWFDLFATASDWDSITGDLVLTRTN